MRIFTGYDEREALGTWVFQHSMMRHTPLRLTFQNLNDKHAPGTNQFTYERYRVPFYCDYRGARAIFADGADMVCVGNVANLAECWQMGKAVQVVQRPDYIATTPKYIGSEMEAENKSYPRKNWSSVMLIDPAHYSWRRIDYSNTDPRYWHEFGWLKDNEIGTLPNEWNRLVDEGDAVLGGKILHWTLGIPAVSPAYEDAPGCDVWYREMAAAMRVPKAKG